MLEFDQSLAQSTMIMDAPGNLRVKGAFCIIAEVHSRHSRVPWWTNDERKIFRIDV